MSKGIKKGISSLSFSMSKLYKRISTTKQSNLVIPIISISIAIFLLGGGLYSMIVRPLPAVYYGGRFLFLYPQLSEQFISDSMVAVALYTFGIIGLIVIYQSTKNIYKPRQAYMMLLVGIVLSLIAYIFLEAVILQKLGG